MKKEQDERLSFNLSNQLKSKPKLILRNLQNKDQFRNKLINKDLSYKNKNNNQFNLDFLLKNMKKHEKIRNYSQSTDFSNQIQANKDENEEKDCQFSSPSESLSYIKSNNLKNNKQNLQNLSTQIEKYLNLIKEINENEIKSKLMPALKSRTSFFSKDKKFVMSNNIKDSQIASISSENQVQQDKRQALSMQKGRKDVVNKNMKMFVSVLKSSTSRPKSRIHCSVVIFNKKVYLFGGQQNLKLNDVWIGNLIFDGKSDEIDINTDEISQVTGSISSERRKSMVTSENLNEKDSILYNKFKNLPSLNNRHTSLYDSLSNINSHTQDEPDVKSKILSQQVKTILNSFHNISNEKKSEIIKGNRFHWMKLSHFQSKPAEERSGHSMCLFEDKVYIYGGKGNVNTNLLTDFIIFDLKTFTFYVPSKNVSLHEIKRRFFHSAVTFKNFMIVQGGVEYNNERINKMNVLSDCFHYNYLSGLWEPLYYKGESFDSLYGQSCLVVMSPEKLESRNYDLYTIYSETFKLYSQIKHEGIYFFGGVDVNGYCNSNVKVLKPFKKPNELVLLDIKGKPPRPRYHASFDFYSKLNISILYGGRNNIDFFNDFYILDVINLQWIKTQILSDSKELDLYRGGHVSFISDDSLYIFGGENGRKIFESDLLKVDLDFENAVKMSYYKGSSVLKLIINSERKGKG